MDLKAINLKTISGIEKQYILYKKECKLLIIWSYIFASKLNYLQSIFNVLGNRHKGKSSVIKVIIIHKYSKNDKNIRKIGII